MRRDLPAFVASRAEDRQQFLRRDEEQPPVVGICLAVKLLSEFAVRHALISGPDRHSAVHGHLEGAELQPGVARTGCVIRRLNLAHQFFSWPRSVQAPGQHSPDRQSIPSPQLPIKRDVVGRDGAVGHRGQTGRQVAAQHLLQRLQLFRFAESRVLLLDSLEQRHGVLQHPVGLAAFVLDDLPTGRIRRALRDAAQLQGGRVHYHCIAGVEHHGMIRVHVQNLARRHAHFHQSRGEGARHHDPGALRLPGGLG